MCDLRAHGMHSLINSSIPKEFARLVQRPLKVITDYSAIPELSSRISFSHLRSEKIPEYFYYDLTDKVKKVSFTTEWTDYTPEPYIYELNDIFLIDGLVITKRGEILCDSMRVFSKINNIFFITNMINKLYSAMGLFSNEKVEFKTYDTVLPFGFKNHYGHYLIDYLPQLWCYDYIKVKNFILGTQNAGSQQVKPVLYDMLQPWNFSSDFVQFAPFCFVHRLYLPSKIFMVKNFISSIVNSIYKKITIYYAYKSKFPQKIYISRSQYPGRKLIDEIECEKIFQENGFTVYYPETMSFADQVNLFSHATHVAGPVGSALHNVLFSLEPTQLKLLILAPSRHERWITNYSVIERSNERIPYYFFGSYSRKNNLYAPWSLSFDKLNKCIKQWLKMTG